MPPRNPTPSPPQPFDVRREWTTIFRLLPYMWLTGPLNIRGRVIAAVALMIAVSVTARRATA